MTQQRGPRIYVNYRHQGDTVTMAELGSKAEAHYWIHHYYKHIGPPALAVYQSQRATQEWRDRVTAWEEGPAQLMAEMVARYGQACPIILGGLPGGRP